MLIWVDLLHDEQAKDLEVRREGEVIYVQTNDIDLTHCNFVRNFTGQIRGQMRKEGVHEEGGGEG